ncbi:MAG: FeoB-associated Cys-rich membrane protein [Opitutus sp.]|nr:FeoB-associated Cys-rich membrane protein [Opitutus sp.]
MSPEFQTIAALVVVALAAIGLIVRAMVKRRHPECGGGCGCAANDVRSKMKR